MTSAGQIVKTLLAKNGPMTTQAFHQYLPTYQTQFVSKTHLKKKILASLEGEGVICKKVKREADSPKPTWEWNFANEEIAEKFKNVNL